LACSLARAPRAPGLSFQAPVPYSFFIWVNTRLAHRKVELYVKKWQSKNMRISDMDELFRCYYSSVHVIRLPDKSRYQLLDQQRSELYAIIEQCCASSYKKKDTRMLPDVDEFGLYLSLAFEHFSHTLSEPFDYVQASMKYQPPPISMADNLRVFVRLVDRHLGTPGDVEKLFTRITGVVASSLLLESLRKRHFGTFP